MGRLRTIARTFYRAVTPAPLRRAIIRHGFGGYSLLPFERQHCIFVHIPKAAGISICTSMFGNMGGGHKTMRDYIEVFGRDTVDRYFKFTFVRNPWDRVLSAYRFLSQGGKTSRDRRWADRWLRAYPDFDSFVMRGLGRPEILDWIHFQPQWQFLVDGDGNLCIDFVGRFERIEADFAFVCSQLNIDAELAHLNRSGAGDYRPYFTDAAREKVAEIYSHDIALFQYGFDA